MLPPLDYYLINAFTTNSPHTGNQAAVVVFPSKDDPRIADDTYKLKVARDFGFAETAFLVPLSQSQGQGDSEWGLRWFTPEVVSPGS